MSQNPEIRNQKRKLAMHLLIASKPVFNPLDELLTEPLYELDYGGELSALLITELARQTKIEMTPAESRVMLQTASGLSALGIAKREIKTVNTVQLQRQMIWRKIRAANPEFDYPNAGNAGSPKLGIFNQTAVLTAITLRLLNQTI